MLCAILVFFILIMYSLTYYNLVYTFFTKKVIKMILTRSKFHNKGCICESVSIIFRNLLKAAIHAIFIEHYQTQITMLIFSDFIFIVFSVIFRKQFLNNFFFILAFAYNLIFFAIDILFLFYFNNPNIVPYSQFDKLIFILILIIIGISLLTSISILFITSKDFIIHKICQLKISKIFHISH